MSATTPTAPENKPLLSDELYQILEALATLILPALGTLYAALAIIWSLPAGDKVIGSIVAIDTFLGVVVKLGEKSYKTSGAKYDGAINVLDTANKTTFSLELNGDPNELKNKNEITFKVNTPPPTPAIPPTVLVPQSTPAPPSQ